MNILCVTEGEAAEIVSQLTQATAALRGNAATNPADLSGVLASGTFQTDGVRALGHWWIADAFVDNVWKGAVN
jgi:hypothetical protein